jgi:hypothetical protein
MLFFHGLGTKVLVLNSMKAVNDLLDKRANTYSDRPLFTVVGSLMGLGRVSSRTLLLCGRPIKYLFRACRSSLTMPPGVNSAS